MKLDTYHRLLWLYDHPDATAKDMAHEFEIKAKSAREWADRLVQDGVLSRSWQGHTLLYRVRNDVRL